MKKLVETDKGYWLRCPSCNNILSKVKLGVLDCKCRQCNRIWTIAINKETIMITQSINENDSVIDLVKGRDNIDELIDQIK